MIRSGLVLVCLFLLSPVPRLLAAVAADYSGTTNINFASAVGIDLTTVTVGSGSNQCLIAALHTQDNVTTVTLIWDPTPGTNQTLTASASNPNAAGSGGQIRFFRLIAPTQGNKILRASWTTSTNGRIGAIAFSGADQTTCWDDSHTVGTTGTSNSASTGAVTSTTDGATVAITSNKSDTYSAMTSGGVDVYRVSNNTIASAMSYTIGGTSNTHSWSIGSSVLWGAMGVHILAASSGAGRKHCMLGFCDELGN